MIITRRGNLGPSVSRWSPFWEILSTHHANNEGRPGGRGWGGGGHDVANFMESGTASFWCCDSHTFVILARPPVFDSWVLSFFSRNVRRLSSPPSRFDAALLCFQPWTRTCSRVLPAFPCRMFAWESDVLLVIAFWIAFRALSRVPVRPPVSPRAFFPRPLVASPSMDKSPSRSTRFTAPLLRIPPRSEPLERPVALLPFILSVDKIFRRVKSRVQEE